MLQSSDSCQNRVSADQHHMTLPRAQVLTHRGFMFLAEHRLKFIFLTHTAHDINCALSQRPDFGAKRLPFLQIGKAVAIELSLAP